VTARDIAAFLGALAASMLPRRVWPRLPSAFPMGGGALAGGILTLFLGAAVGIPGFLHHAGLLSSELNDATLKVAAAQIASGMREGDPGEVKFNTPGLVALSIVTFLLMTPKGWATMYLMGSGAFRAIAATFDDPVGDPLLSAADAVLWRQRERSRVTRALEEREALEGPEIADRIVTGASAGLPGCDFVVVASRRKDGWERGVAVFTQETCYRLGDPVERTIAGRLRTLYPLTEHKDLEAVRRSVRYDLPAGIPSSSPRADA
jgi:hypothetical protein